MRVYFIPEIANPQNIFCKEVSSVEEARIVLDTLADFNLFEIEQKIVPDIAGNMSGLQVWNENEQEWEEWEDEEGNNIKDLE